MNTQKFPGVDIDAAHRVWRRPWTQHEIALLREQYGTRPVEDIAKDMKRRVGAVRSMASRLGLTRRGWLTTETRLLREQFHQSSLAVLSTKLGRSESAVRNFACRLGLRRRQRRAGGSDVPAV